MKVDILLVGVGGQGTVLSSDIICDAALNAGYDVKKSEIHGMAQRGGSVVSHVRVSDKVMSPVMQLGEADIIVSFENMEYLRYLEFVGADTELILSTYRVFPPAVLSGKEAYPEEETEGHKDTFKSVLEYDAMEVAKEIGNPKVAGMVMLGSLAKKLPFDKEAWAKAISDGVPPKTIELNLKAFDVGFEKA